MRAISMLVTNVKEKNGDKFLMLVMDLVILVTISLYFSVNDKFREISKFSFLSLNCHF